MPTASLGSNARPRRWSLSTTRTSRRGAFSPGLDCRSPDGQWLAVGDQAYVLEYSTNFLAGAAGRLLRVDGVRGTSLVIADGLRSPTSLATDTRTGDLFVTEFFANRVMRVLVPK